MPATHLFLPQATATLPKEIQPGIERVQSGPKASQRALLRRSSSKPRNRKGQVTDWQALRARTTSRAKDMFGFEIRMWHSSKAGSLTNLATADCWYNATMETYGAIAEVRCKNHADRIDSSVKSIPTTLIKSTLPSSTKRMIWQSSRTSMRLQSSTIFTPAIKQI